MQSLRGANLGHGLLQQTTDKIHGTVLLIWSPQGHELARVARGEEALVQVVLDASNVVQWSSGSVQGCMVAHPETAWLRIIRASEGHTTTAWRCYCSRPPAMPSLSCNSGHGSLQKNFGASGIFRVVSLQRCCYRCGGSLKNGTARWSCQQCEYEVCLNCIEEEAWQQSARTGGTVNGTLEDLLGDLSPQSSSSSPSRSRRRVSVDSRSEGRSASVLPRSNSQRGRPESLDKVPFLGVRPLGQIQSETSKRLQRLLQHGDAQGASRTLARAKQLDVASEDLVGAEGALQLLETQGPFNLLGAQP